MMPSDRHMFVTPQWTLILTGKSEYFKNEICAN